jgi:serine/threonine-protein kinase
MADETRDDEHPWGSTETSSNEEEEATHADSTDAATVPRHADGAGHGVAYPGTVVAPSVTVDLPAPARARREDDRADPASSVARYLDRGVLGRGGMGEVRLVQDRALGREIAVKSIRVGLSGSGGMRERFLREARIQGQLEHPSIVPVYELGADADGNEYFTMKRVAGRTLHGILRSLAKGDATVTREFPKNRLLAVIHQICLAVAYAHAKGVVHRDLKPRNVMVGDFGEVYVLDWGIARLVGEAAVGSVDGTLLGTPGYMAPEQIDSPDRADGRSDVYSLGAILFEALALSPWHSQGSVPEAIGSTVDRRAARPSTRVPDRDIPPELDDLCARATAYAPEDRVQTARELATAIEQYLEGDRDLERRREQARGHALAAREASRRAAGGGPDALAARREALREAGRAVALDPEGREGLRAAVELMLEPPKEVPAEVRDELDRAQADRIRAGIRTGVVVFGAFMAAALGVPVIAGPLDW